MSQNLQTKGITSHSILYSCWCCFLLFTTLPLFAQVRGPYLQSGTPTSMVIRWRTDVAANSQVRYGPSATQLTAVANNLTDTVEHEIKLIGLSPLTKYYYSIGSTTAVLQGDTANYFYTLPRTGATGLVRIGVLGDCGNNSTNQIQVRDQLKNYLSGNYMNAWILLGDNAYYSATDGEYQANFFNYYQDKFLKQSPLYPCPGNHDYADGSNGSQNTHNIPYYSVFTMPVNGEAGGTPSNNKAYYSFDVGNVHFLSLDSYGREDNATHLYDTLGKQVQWIKQDLAANINKEWVVAYWHHPPYTKGSHDSDSPGDLTAIRTNFLRILERMGVDLVLCGHSHVYERSSLIAGHYGPSSSFDPLINNLSNSSGLYNGTANSCPYVKDMINHQQGTVYVVSGSAGQLGGQQASFPHKAMYYSNTSVGGAMLLEVQNNRLDAKWICSDGVIRDQFSMMKGINKRKDTTIGAGSPITLTASYIGTYNWLPDHQTTRSITVNPAIGPSRYIVKDNFSCIADTFNVNTISILPLTWGSIKGWYINAQQTIQLQWQTFNETDSKYFEIERSTDGVNFTKVGRVNALGNQYSNFTYQFLDKNLSANAEIFLYRLKQIDMQNGILYSPVVAIKTRSSSSDLDVQVVPNPAHSNEMKIRLLGSNSSPASLKLTDASGKLLVSKSVVLNASLQSFLPLLQAGTYFLTLQTSSSAATQKIMITN